LRALVQDALYKVERAAAGLRRAAPFAARGGGGGVGGGVGGGAREADGGAALMAVLRTALPALLAHFEAAARRVGATEDTLDVDPAADGGLPDPVLSDVLVAIAAVFERLLCCQARVTFLMFRWAEALGPINRREVRDQTPIRAYVTSL
jgi:hypothetical protein